MQKKSNATFQLAGFLVVQILLLSMYCSSAIATTIIDEIFYDGAEGALEVRDVVFDQGGAHFDGQFTGIDYSAEVLPNEGTVEILIRPQDYAGAVLDTRGADLRVAGDLYLGIVDGPYGSSTLENAIAGQVFFTIDPGPGTNPGLLPGVVSTTVVTDGAWHIVSVSYGSGGVALYIDGVLEDTAESITVQPINSLVSLGDFADEVITGPSSFLGELLRFRTSTMQNDVTSLCDGLPTLTDDCMLVTGVPQELVRNRALLLDQNWPNPFNPSTTISFHLAGPSEVSLRIYNSSGQLVRTILAGEIRSAGSHQLNWNGRDDKGLSVASGAYFYRLDAGGRSETKTMVLIR